MRIRLAPRILAVALLVALFAAPASLYEGLISPWTRWGEPLLIAVAIFAVLGGVLGGARPAGVRQPRLRARKAPAAGKAAETYAQDSAGGAMVNVEGSEGAEGQPDPTLSEALDELEPENLVDLARALQEMGRHGDALEVLARIAELRGSNYGGEVARALRRLRHRLHQEVPTST